MKFHPPKVPSWCQECDETISDEPNAFIEARTAHGHGPLLLCLKHARQFANEFQAARLGILRGGKLEDAGR